MQPGDQTGTPSDDMPPPLPESFYGAPLNLLLLGYIRPEYDYVSKESLIEDIQTDISVAHRSLNRQAYRDLDSSGAAEGSWLRTFD